MCIRRSIEHFRKLNLCAYRILSDFFGRGLRMEGLAALTKWDTVIDILEPPVRLASGYPSR